MPPPDPGRVRFKVEIASPLGQNVVSITPSRTRVDSTDPDKKVTFTATFAAGYELDYFTVGGQRISGCAYEVTRTVTVNAVAKKKSDMEKWKRQIDDMVDEANAKAKEKLDTLSADDRKKIKKFEEKINKIKGISHRGANYFNFGANASAPVFASKYTVITAGLKGYTFAALGGGLAADGMFIATAGFMSAVIGRSINNNKWNEDVVLTEYVKRLMKEQMNLTEQVNDAAGIKNCVNQIRKNNLLTKA